MNISRLRGQILVKSVLDGVKVLWFEILRARGPGKFYSARTTGVKVGVMDQHFGKNVSSMKQFEFVSAGKALSPQE